MMNARMALYLARKHHGGQKRDTGEDYVWHCVAVAQHSGVIGAGEELYAAALLHDIVEDTDMTLEGLGNRGASDYQLQVIDNVTHRPNEPRADYLERVCSLEGSAMVKLADSLHNYDGLPFLSGLEGNAPSGETWADCAARRRKKYQNNVKILEDFLGVHPDYRTRFIDG